MSGRTLGLAIGLVLTAGIVVGADPAESAARAATSLALRYTCSFPVINDAAVTVRAHLDSPTSALVDRRTPALAIDAVVTLDAATARRLRLLGLRSIEGRANLPVFVIAPQGNIRLAVPFTVPRAAVPESGAFDVPATGTAPGTTFTQPGTAKMTVGDFSLHLTPRGANGNVTLPGTFDASCTQNPGQNATLASIKISEPAEVTDRGTRGVTSAPPKAPEDAGTTDGDTTPGAAPTSSLSPGASTEGSSSALNPTTTDTTRVGRVDASGSAGSAGRDLALLAVGALLVGALAVTAAYLVRLRGRHRSAVGAIPAPRQRRWRRASAGNRRNADRRSAGVEHVG